MKIDFLKKRNSLKKENFSFNPNLYWKIAIFGAFLMIIFAGIFGYYLFSQINKESLSLELNSSGKTSLILCWMAAMAWTVIMRIGRTPEFWRANRCRISIPMAPMRRSPRRSGTSFPRNNWCAVINWKSSRRESGGCGWGSRRSSHLSTFARSQPGPTNLPR